MPIILYAYEVVPGHDETLMFSQTLEECMLAAKELREDLRDREADENGYIGPMGVYECEIDISNIAVLIDVLNDASDEAVACG